MEYLIGFLIGCVVTSVISWIRHPVLGQLKVDERNPEDVKWRFVLTKDINFAIHKRIILKVDNHADLSQN